MNGPRIRIATRGSRLAQVQANWVAAALQRHHPGLSVEIVIVRTQGDQLIDAPLAQISGKGAFTREIERALLDGRADLAVHSLKDLPTEPTPGLRLAATPPREDPHDVIVAAHAMAWKTLDKGAVVGTSSLRRQAQILHANPCLKVRPLRGNVPTRVRKALEGEVAAVILAQAGIRRLDLHPPFIEVIAFSDMLPAPGQGALGLQIRDEDWETAGYVESLNDAATSIACRAEREFLHALGGGCRVPIAALGVVEGDHIFLDGLVSSIDGVRFFRDRIEGASRDPEGVGEALAKRLLSRGAGEVLAEVARAAEAESRGALDEAAGPLSGVPVIVTRDEDVDGPLSRALLALGAEVVCVPLLEHLPPLNLEPLRQAARELDTFDWIVFTSARGVDALVAALAPTGESLSGYSGRIACVGPATAERVGAVGAPVRLVPKEAKGEALAAAFSDMVRQGLLRPGAQVLFPRADRGGTEVIDALLEFGAIVIDVEAYRTVTSPRAGLDLRRRLESGRRCVVTLASGSAVEALFDLAGEEGVTAIAEKCILSTIGPSTSAALRAHGIEPGVEAAKHTFEGLAQALAEYYQGGAAARPSKSRKDSKR